MSFRTPYLMFLADAPDQLAAKTAAGVAHWRPDWCIGQLRLDGCKADLKLPDMTVDEAAQSGVGTVIVGVANRGGRLSPASIVPLKRALELGMDLASGLHIKLADVPELKAAAAAHGRTISDVRHPREDFDTGSGEDRSGKRLLAVGTDCSVGKMYTTLAIEKEMQSRGMKATFRATGQTGIFIAGSGVSVDAVVSDFISGAVEKISPANDADHWDIIEGQGSLFHASFAGVSLGLLHGAQADALVMCHETTRTHMRGLPKSPIPDIADCIALNERCAQLTNPAAKVVGFAINCAALDAAATERTLKEFEDKYGMPAVDPVKTGVGPLVDIVAGI